jgi:hypothetical protein
VLDGEAQRACPFAVVQGEKHFLVSHFGILPFAGEGDVLQCCGDVINAVAEFMVSAQTASPIRRPSVLHGMCCADR